MECENFAEIAYDLASDALMESSLRNSALEHAHHCHECGMRLAAERALNQALRFAAEAEVECAPPSIKVALEKAFAEMSASTLTSRQAGEATRTRVVRTRRFWQAAAAALLILFAAATVYIIRSGGTARPTSGPASPISVANGDPSKAGDRPAEPRAPSKIDSSGGQPVIGPRPGRRTPSLQLRLASTQAGAAIENPGESKTDSEAMTDFIPLTYLTRSTAIESGQVMRVRVPVSTFIALGVPINTQHAADLVNAEVVVGDDGVMRAVRLLR